LIEMFSTIKDDLFKVSIRSISIYNTRIRGIMDRTDTDKNRIKTELILIMDSILIRILIMDRTDRDPQKLK